MQNHHKPQFCHIELEIFFKMRTACTCRITLKPWKPIFPWLKQCLLYNIVPQLRTIKQDSIHRPRTPGGPFFTHWHEWFSTLLCLVRLLLADYCSPHCLFLSHKTLLSLLVWSNMDPQSRELEDSLLPLNVSNFHSEVIQNCKPKQISGVISKKRCWCEFMWFVSFLRVFSGMK